MSDAAADALPSIEEWVRAKRKDEITPVDVVETLGLNLLHSHGQDEESRWAVSAMAAGQYRALAKPRTRLASANTPESVVDLLKESEHVIVVIGSGASPHVQGYKGFFEALSEEERCGIPDADALFDPGRFVDQPKPLLAYLKSLLPGTYAPSLAHRFVRELETRGKLLRVYSQNLDGFERTLGVDNVVQCHGSLATASCVSCRLRVPFEAGAGVGVPSCTQCTHALNVLKPDVAFLNELPASVKAEEALRHDLPRCDLLLVLGSELGVEPLRRLPACLPHTVPQLVVGPSSPPFQHEWDVHLQGECDLVMAYLADSLCWSDLLAPSIPAGEPPAVVAPSAVAVAEGSTPTFVFGEKAATAQGLTQIQTPLAITPQYFKRGQKRWGLSFSGATLAGSGVGARAALAKTAPLVGIRKQTK